MKIIAASDLHGAHGTYAWLVGIARERAADALVLGGDLLGCPPGAATIEEAQAQDAEAILDLLEPCPCPVLYVMGNDDLVELPPRSPHIISLHSRRWDAAPYSFVGYQYTVPFMAGVFEKPDDEIAVDLERLASQVDHNTVLVTHSPAFGILDVGILEGHAGSHAILDLIHDRRPRAHIHGHVHQCAGRQGMHWNVATHRVRRAVMLDLDTLQDEVITQV